MNINGNKENNYSGGYIGQVLVSHSLNLRFLSILWTNWMENCEAMTSSTHLFAYSYQVFKKCFVKIAKFTISHLPYFLSNSHQKKIVHCSVWNFLNLSQPGLESSFKFKSFPRDYGMKKSALPKGTLYTRRFDPGTSCWGSRVYNQLSYELSSVAWMCFS